jgi:hypothetical protein
MSLVLSLKAIFVQFFIAKSILMITIGGIVGWHLSPVCFVGGGRSGNRKDILLSGLLHCKKHSKHLRKHLLVLSIFFAPPKPFVVLTPEVLFPAAIFSFPEAIITVLLSLHHCHPHHVLETEVF